MIEDEVEEKIDALESRAELLEKVLSDIRRLRDLDDSALRIDSNNFLKGIPKSLLHYKSWNGKPSNKLSKLLPYFMNPISRFEEDIRDRYIECYRALGIFAQLGDPLAEKIIEFIGQDAEKLRAVLEENPFRQGLVDKFLNRSMKQNEYEGYLSGKLEIGCLYSPKIKRFYLC